MRRRLIFAAVIVNLLLAFALLRSPVATQMFQFMAFQDCCKGEGFEAYCCQNCCFFVNDCEEDEDCGPN